MDDKETSPAYAKLPVADPSYSQFETLSKAPRDTKVITACNWLLYSTSEDDDRSLQ